jgi:Domain of unknown function (DUF4342)
MSGSNFESITESPSREPGWILIVSYAPEDRGKRYTSVMQEFGRLYEEFKVQANELSDKVKGLIHEGNVRRVIIKDEDGNKFIEIPVTVASLAVILAPVLAAVGAIATLVSKFTVVVERTDRSATAGAGAQQRGSSESRIGAVETQVSMKDTVGQRIDTKGTKVEDLAGTGEHDAQGG